MKKYLFIFLLLLSAGSTFAQADTSIKLLREIPGEYSDFTVDNLGNIFLLDQTNQLKKLSPEGDSIAVYSNATSFGTVYSIDASNPMKVLLYYRDFSTIVVLDRLLNPRNTIDLRKLNIFQAKAICQSYDNAAWVYDEGEAKLKRIGDDGSLIDQTGDLRLQLEEAPSPEWMEDNDRLVYLYDSARGLLVFDYYGTLKSKIAFLGWQDFQVVGKYIIGRKGALLERYQLSSLSLQERSLPA
ncbi:MAG TPA: hypothetical protein VGM41_15640, partial [Chitinophagaceae bacterium]